MSDYGGLRCVRCQCRWGAVNHSEKLWPEVIRLWPAFKPLAIALRDEKKWPWEMDVNIYISGNQAGDDPSLLGWLLEHADHGIEMVSEYVDCTGLENSHKPVLLLPPIVTQASPMPMNNPAFEAGVQVGISEAYRQWYERVRAYALGTIPLAEVYPPADPDKGPVVTITGAGAGERK